MNASAETALMKIKADSMPDLNIGPGKIGGSFLAHKIQFDMRPD